MAINILLNLADNRILTTKVDRPDNRILTTKLNRHPESPSTSQRFLQLASRGEGSCACFLMEPKQAWNTLNPPINILLAPWTNLPTYT